jgi:hypothetical protein
MLPFVMLNFPTQTKYASWGRVVNGGWSLSVTPSDQLFPAFERDHHGHPGILPDDDSKVITAAPPVVCSMFSPYTTTPTYILTSLLATCGHAAITIDAA